MAYRPFTPRMHFTEMQPGLHEVLDNVDPVHIRLARDVEVTARQIHVPETILGHSFTAVEVVYPERTASFFGIPVTVSQSEYAIQLNPLQGEHADKLTIMSGGRMLRLKDYQNTHGHTEVRAKEGRREPKPADAALVNAVIGVLPLFFKTPDNNVK